MLSEAALIGSDDIFPCFFLTIVVVQNVALHMTGSNMTTGCDVTEGHVTGSDIIFPRFFLTVVVAQNVPLRMTESSMATEGHVPGSGWFPLGCFRICSRLLCSTPSSLPRFFGIFVIFSEIF